MTFGENKKIFFSLIDEYAPENTAFTEDEDADIKCATLYAPTYQELADKKPIIKTKDINHEYTGEDFYQEYNLPTHKQIKEVISLDENNRHVNGDYYFLGEKKIYINKNSKARYIIEYSVDPEIINDETDDDYELEIDQDAQMILPYMVASDYLKTDPSANYVAFEKVYLRKLQNFDTRKRGIMVNIVEGDL